MKKMFNEGNQIHNFMSSSVSGTVINYGSGSTSQKITVPTVPVPVPVPQHWSEVLMNLSTHNLTFSKNLESHFIIFSPVLEVRLPTGAEFGTRPVWCTDIEHILLA